MGEVFHNSITNITNITTVVKKKKVVHFSISSLVTVVVLNFFLSSGCLNCGNGVGK